MNTNEAFSDTASVITKRFFRSGCLSSELTPFEVHRLQLEDGWLHTTGVSNESRVIEVDYLDNQRIDVFEFICYGSVTLTNEIQISILMLVEESSFTACVINRGTTRYLQTQTRLMFAYRTMGRQRMSSCIPTRHWNHESHTQEWYYSVTIDRFGDLNRWMYQLYGSWSSVCGVGRSV